MRRRLALSAIVGLPMLAWLALSESPSERRLRRLNDAIRNHGLGTVPGVLAPRIAEQVPWLARSAGASGDIAINGPIDPRRLNVLVCTSQFENLTGCGTGNAVYDPSLQTIFVDLGLIWPFEALVEGNSGTITMFKIDYAGSIASLASFIVSHELGHWKRKSRASGCFDYSGRSGLLSGSSSNGRVDWTEEQAADTLAVGIITDAYQAASKPEFIGLNRPDAVGVDPRNLTPRQAAVADILVGALEMTKLLLFSSGPYSPFRSDDRHPSFLQRANDAIASALGGDNHLAELDYLPSVREELGRIQLFAGIEHTEIIVPDPISRADLRGGDLWLGTVPVVPTPASQAEAEARTDEQRYPVERIYRVPVSHIEAAGASSRLSLARDGAVLDGRSTPQAVAEEYSMPGLWLGSRFEDGETRIGLPAPDLRGTLRPDKGHDGYSLFPGFLYTGTLWTLVDASGGVHSIDEDDVVRAAQALGCQDVSLGPFRYVENRIEIPAYLSRGGHGRAFTVLALSLPDAAALSLSEWPPFNPPSGVPALGASLRTRDGWWIPVALGPSGKTERWQMWHLSRDKPPYMFTEQPTLFGIALQSGGNLPARIGPPREPRSVAVSDDRIIFGFEGDSLYCLNIAKRSTRIVFHPIIGGLRIIEIDDGRIMLWIGNGRKAYVLSLASNWEVN